jgi:hypothetical protein
MSVKLGIIDTCKFSGCSSVLGEGKTHEEVEKKREGKFVPCPQCGIARYCSYRCLYDDFPDHNKVCRPLTTAMKRVTLVADMIQDNQKLLAFIRNLCVENIGSNSDMFLLIEVTNSFDEKGDLKQPFSFDHSTYPIGEQKQQLLGAIKNFGLAKEIKYIVSVGHREPQPKIQDEMSTQLLLIDRSEVASSSFTNEPKMETTPTDE